jgi:hypothetical protein
MPIIMASQSKTAEHHPQPYGRGIEIRGLRPKKMANAKAPGCPECLWNQPDAFITCKHDTVKMPVMTHRSPKVLQAFS